MNSLFDLLKLDLSIALLLFLLAYYLARKACVLGMCLCLLLSCLSFFSGGVALLALKIFLTLIILTTAVVRRNTEVSSFDGLTTIDLVVAYVYLAVIFSVRDFEYVYSEMFALLVFASALMWLVLRRPKYFILNITELGFGAFISFSYVNLNAPSDKFTVGLFIVASMTLLLIYKLAVGQWTDIKLTLNITHTKLRQIGQPNDQAR